MSELPPVLPNDRALSPGPEMPPRSPGESIPSVTASGPGEPGPLPPPPSFGKQAAQLVIIPAVIVILCIGMAVLFGKLAGGRDSIDNNLARLEQDSGGGRMPFGLQDPRYKERGLAAYNIATQIPAIRDPDQRRRISDRLITILRDHVGPTELELHVYLLTAVGQLGQEGGLAAIREWFKAPQAVSRQGAVRGLLSWPDAEAARDLIEEVVPLLRDEPAVAAEAAAALGELAQPGDEATITALRQAMNILSSERREVQWNAAVALARLGDAQGSAFVAEVLLDPQALSKLPQAMDGPAAETTMSPGSQDRLMLSVLASAPDMKDERIWAKIQLIADGGGDYRLGVRKAALELLSKRSSE